MLSIIIHLLKLCQQAIHGYRETEKSQWNESNSRTLDRLKCLVFGPGASVLKHVHVLDLSEDGHIKPHLDSVKVLHCAALE